MSYILIYLASLRQKIKYKLLMLFALLLYTIGGITSQTDLLFNFINIIVLISIPTLMQFIKKGNKYISIFSILIYSIIIDIVCYFLYPQFALDINGNKISLILYIWNGIVFNYKGILISSAVCFIISFCLGFKEIKDESKITCQ